MRATSQSGQGHADHIHGVSALDDRDVGSASPGGRDWKKSVLVLGLGALSWVATYVGMLELIERA